jgi:hypothetical protein
LGPGHYERQEPQVVPSTDDSVVSTQCASTWHRPRGATHGQRRLVRSCVLCSSSACVFARWVAGATHCRWGHRDSVVGCSSSAHRGRGVCRWSLRNSVCAVCICGCRSSTTRRRCRRRGPVCVDRPSRVDCVVRSDVFLSCVRDAVQGNWRDRGCRVRCPRRVQAHVSSVEEVPSSSPPYCCQGRAPRARAAPHACTIRPASTRARCCTRRCCNRLRRRSQGDDGRRHASGEI